MLGAKLVARLVEGLRHFHWKFFFVSVLAIMAVLTSAFVILMSPFCAMSLYNRALFGPLKYPAGAYDQPNVDGITPSDHYFKAVDGNSLHAWYYQAPGAKHVVLWSHGQGANISYGKRLYSIFISEGNSVFAYDYEGYGRSEGQPTMDRICEDGHAAYHYLVDKLKVSPDRLILFGESLGTVVTGDVANTEKAGAVILQCPLYSVLDRGRELLPWLTLYPEWMWPRNGLNISRVFGKPHAPLLVIAGTKDRTTTVRQADILFAGASEPKTYIRIPGAGHTDPVMISSPIYLSGLRAFFGSD